MNIRIEITQATNGGYVIEVDKYGPKACSYIATDVVGLKQVIHDVIVQWCTKEN